MRNEKRSSLTEKEDLTIRIHVEGGISIIKMYIDGNTHLDHHELAELICSTIPTSYQEYID